MKNFITILVLLYSINAMGQSDTSTLDSLTPPHVTVMGLFFNEEDSVKIRLYNSEFIDSNSEPNWRFANELDDIKNYGVCLEIGSAWLLAFIRKDKEPKYLYVIATHEEKVYQNIDFNSGRNGVLKYDYHINEYILDIIAKD